MASPKRLRVLIIDDNEMMRELLRSIIERSETFEVVGDACCGKTGMEQVGNLKPDLVCLDVHMPNSNGLDILEQIRQAFPGVAVLMITASNDMETVQTALRLGADGFILKPFTSVTVLNAMKKCKAMQQLRLFPVWKAPSFRGK